MSRARLSRDGSLVRLSPRGVLSSAPGPRRHLAIVRSSADHRQSAQSRSALDIRRSASRTPHQIFERRAALASMSAPAAGRGTTSGSGQLETGRTMSRASRSILGHGRLCNHISQQLLAICKVVLHSELNCTVDDDLTRSGIAHDLDAADCATADHLASEAEEDVAPTTRSF